VTSKLGVLHALLACRSVDFASGRPRDCWWWVRHDSAATPGLHVLVGNAFAALSYDGSWAGDALLAGC